MFRITVALSATFIIIVLIGPILPSYFPSLLQDRRDFWIHKDDNNNNNNKQQTHSALKDSESPGKILHGDSFEKRNDETLQSSNHSVMEMEDQHPKHHGSFTHGNPMEVLLPSIGGEPTSAAEKLTCPASVLSFVINATDVKDECEGLRKAFDKTCGGGQVPNAAAVPNAGMKHGGNSKMPPKRRRLSVVGRDVIWDAIDAVQQIFPGGKWDSWSIRFKNLKLQQQQRRRLMDSSQQHHEGMQQEDTEDDNLQSQNQQQQEQEQQQQEQQQQQVDDNEKPLSPTIPTSNEDLSENTIEGALLLNTDYLFDNNHTTTTKTATTTTIQQDSIQGQEEVLDRQSYNEKVDANLATQSKPNDVEPSSSTTVTVATTTTTTATTNVPETIITTQTCCRSILKVFHDECDTPEEEEFNDKRLFVIVCVIALCGVVKSLIRHFKLRWLPEAGGCILVGMVGGLFLRFLPNMDFGFQHDMFLRLMVPPIGKTIYLLLE